MYLVAYITQNGAPKTGLTPTVDYYDLSDNSKAVDGETMSEVGSGLYSYNFSGYDPGKDYSGIVDGGATLNNSERYVPINSGINAVGEIIENGITLQQLGMILLAVFAAKRTGMGTTDTQFRDQLDTKNRLNVSLDVNGNISSITLDLT